MTNTNPTNPSMRTLAARFTPPLATKAAAQRRREHLRFLIKLAQIDPAALVSDERPGDVANLCSDLGRFGFVPALVADPKLSLQTMVKLITENPKRQLEPLIAKIRELLDAAADGDALVIPLRAAFDLVFDASGLKSLESQGLPAAVAHRVQQPAQFTFRLTAKPQGTLDLRHHWITFLFNSMRSLDSEEGAMIRRCLRERCKRVFLASRVSQVYCTRSCTMAENFRQYREREIAREGIETYRQERNRVSSKSYANRKEGK